MSGKNPFEIVINTAHKKSGAMAEIQKAVKKLSSLEVFVGVPKESNATHKLENGKAPVTPITNAHLAYIHTYGSPVRNIPSREFLETSMKHHKDELAAEYRKASEKALQGNVAGVEAALEKMGMHGANVAKAWFNNPANGWAPDTPETIKAKGSAKPLIDTGQLRKAITYVVDKKGARR